MFSNLKGGLFRPGSYLEPRALFGLVISLVCILLVFRAFPIRESWVAVRSVESGPIIAACFLTLANLFLRGMRWSLILDRPGFGPFLTSCSVCSVGLGLNAVLPAKAGEVARVIYASRFQRVSYSVATTSVVIERIFDLVILLGIAAIASQAYSGSEPLQQILLILGRASGLAVIILLLLGHRKLNRRLRFALIRMGFGRPGSGRRLVWFLAQIPDVFARFTSVRLLLYVSLSSIAMWMALALGVLVMSNAFAGIELTLPAAVTFAALTVIASAAPAAPGAWGVFEASGLAVLFIVGEVTEQPVAVAFVVLVHLVQYIPILFGAVLGALYLGVAKN